MTDTPSRRPAESPAPSAPSAPESADTPVAAPIAPVAAAAAAANADAAKDDAAAGTPTPVIPAQGGTAAQPPRRSYARTDAGHGSGVPGPAWPTAPAPVPVPAPGWNPLPLAPVPGWVWSGSWIPKPGIVPLRPLGIHEILSGAFAVLTRYWRTALTVSAAIAAVSQLLVALVTAALPAGSTGVDLTLSSTGDPNADLHRALTSLADIAPLGGATGAISLFAGTLATAALASVASKAVMGKPASTAETWRTVSSRLPSVLGLALFVTCATFGTLAASAAPSLIANAAGASDAAISATALLLLPGSAVALWLCISMSLAAPALVLERQGIRAAVARSFRLVRGAWWRVLGVTVVVGILTDMASGIIALPFTVVDFAINGSGSDGTAASSLLLAAIGGFIGGALTFPVTAGSSTLLYIDQRIRREALDLELAAAVGIPDYGH